MGVLTESILDDVLRCVPEYSWAPASEIIRHLRDSSHLAQALTELYRDGLIERRLRPGALAYEYRRKAENRALCRCDSCRMLRRHTEIRGAGTGVFVNFETIEEADSMRFLIGETGKVGDSDEPPPNEDHLKSGKWFDG